MKKKLSLLGVTLLCSSALATTFVSPSNVFAEGTTTSDSAETPSMSRYQLQSLINTSKGYLSNSSLYDSEKLEILNYFVNHAQMVLDNANSSEEEILNAIDMLNAANDVVAGTNSTSSSSSEAESSSTESTSSSSSEAESSSTESTSSSSSESESSSTESTSSSSSEAESSSTESTSSSSSEAESSSTESTNSSSSEELKPTINVSDKTMYVGDKLTEEDILNWATFEHADGLKVGFKVLGNPIQVLKKDNTLVEPGVHQIKYYVEGKTRASENHVAEKTITLTVKANGTTDTTTSTTSSSSSSTGITSTTNSSGTYTKPAGKTTPISSASTTAGLPQTGETNSPLLTVIGSMTLLAGGAYLLTLKRKKSN